MVVEPSDCATHGCPDGVLARKADGRGTVNQKALAHSPMNAPFVGYGSTSI